MTDRERPEAPARKRQVRIIVDVTDSGTITFVATTKLGDLFATGQGQSESEALISLRDEIQRRNTLERVREGYPKTIEVEW